MFQSAASNHSDPAASDSMAPNPTWVVDYPGVNRRFAPPQPIDALSHAPAGGFGRRSGDTYLESAVASASPAKLRLMLIERGVETARHLAGLWRDTPGKRGTNEHSLKLFELLSELLSGVTDDKVEVCRTVADLYVFLCQHMLAAEENGDATMIDEIRLVLETEAETWRMVCAQEAARSPSTPRPAASRAGGIAATESLVGGLNLEG